MRVSACLIAVFTIALLSGSIAEAQTCSAIQDDAFDFSEDVGDDAETFRQSVGAAPTAGDCTKICAAAAKGCKKSLVLDLKDGLAEDATVDKMGKTMCATAANPTACKANLKATKALVKLVFKNEKAAVTAACADPNLIASCNVFCTTQVQPADCEAAFGL
jgi:hypothetical protein